MSSVKRQGRPKLAIALLIIALAALYFGHGKKFIGFAWNPEEQACLPDLNVAFFVYSQPRVVSRGDYLFWKPYGALSYVREAYVLKEVAGVPGDKLKISDGTVFINGKIAVKGLENAPLYGKRPQDFEIEQTIPAGRFFMIGTVKYSNDSRYWGYLPMEKVEGFAYRIF